MHNNHKYIVNSSINIIARYIKYKIYIYDKYNIRMNHENYNNDDDTDINTWKIIIHKIIRLAI